VIIEFHERVTPDIPRTFAAVPVNTK